MYKYKIYIIIALAFFCTSTVQSRFISGDSKTEIIFFYQRGCPNCSEMHKLLEECIEPEYNDDIKIFDTRKPENIRLIQKVSEKYGSPVSIPIVFIGYNYLQDADKDLL